MSASCKPANKTCRMLRANRTRLRNETAPHRVSERQRRKQWYSAVVSVLRLSSDQINFVIVCWLLLVTYAAYTPTGACSLRQPRSCGGRALSAPKGNKAGPFKGSKSRKRNNSLPYGKSLRSKHGSTLALLAMVLNMAEGDIPIKIESKRYPH